MACAGATELGDVCNACAHPVFFRSAYMLPPEEEDAYYGRASWPSNCSQVIYAFPNTGHVWMCMTPWEELAPGETLHVPLDAPLPEYIIAGNASVRNLWWRYTAHVVNADGGGYSLTRGVLGSQLLRVSSEAPFAELSSPFGSFMMDFDTCYPPHAPSAADCTYWARVRRSLPCMPGISDIYLLSQCGVATPFAQAPPVVRAPPDWSGAGSPTTSLVLRCPGYPGPAANATPGWLPPDVVPLRVRSECRLPVSFAASFPQDGGEHACTQEDMWGKALYDGEAPPAICVTHSTTGLQPNDTAVVDATRAAPGGGLPAGAWFSASAGGDDPATLSLPNYWLSALNGSRCFFMNEPGAPLREWFSGTPAEDEGWGMQSLAVWAPLPQARTWRGGGTGCCGRLSLTAPRILWPLSRTDRCPCRRGAMARPRWRWKQTAPSCCAARPSSRPEATSLRCAPRPELQPAALLPPNAPLLPVPAFSSHPSIQPPWRCTAAGHPRPPRIAGVWLRLRGAAPGAGAVLASVNLARVNLTGRQAALRRGHSTSPPPTSARCRCCRNQERYAAKRPPATAARMAAKKRR